MPAFNIGITTRFNNHILPPQFLENSLLLISELGMPFSQSKEEIKDYTLNDKDIIVGDEIIEVKSRNLFFTDNPSSFPYDELIVDTVSGYEAKEKKPLAYVMVSQKTGGMFIIPTAFSASWKIEKKYDRERKHEDFFYLVSKSFGRPFLQLVNKLKGAA